MSSMTLIVLIAGIAAILLNAKMALGWIRLARRGTPRRVELFYSAEDGGWIGTCDIPGISAFGDTPEAVLLELRTVYQLAVEAYQSEGWSLP